MQLTRLPARFASIFMPIILSIIMTMVVSAVATLKNLGFGEGFAGVRTWVVAFPTLLMALPLTRRIIRVFVQQAE